MMNNEEFVGNDVSLEQITDELNINGLASVVKEEMPGSSMMDFLSQLNSDNASCSNYVANYEVVETSTTIPEAEPQQISLTADQINEILNSNPNDVGNFEKIPINFKDIYNLDGIKTEPLTSYSHFITKKTDENGKSVKIWECGLCHKEFGHQYILMRHLPIHTNERKYVCNQCGKAFRQMSTLSQHRAIHSKLRPYVCEICNKTFNRVSTLISHKKTHTDIKVHKCNICNKAFHQKGNLRNHIFTHTNARPYKCDICEKGFNQMSNLMCHKLKTHQKTDKPKFICPICNEEFDRRIGLRNHEQYEHGDQNVNNVTIGTSFVSNNDGILVPPIKTTAMLHATKINQVPFAILRPFASTPALVKVLPAGDNQMLVPATAEDIKKYGEIMYKKEDENVATPNNNGRDEKLQIRIPVVANVIQSFSDGICRMTVLSPELKDDDKYFITTIPNQVEVDTTSDFSLVTPALTNFENLNGSDPLNLLKDDILNEPGQETSQDNQITDFFKCENEIFEFLKI